MEKSSSLYPLEPDLTQYIDCANVYDSCPICRRGRSNPNINAIFLKQGHSISFYSKEGKTRPNASIISTVFDLWRLMELAQDYIENQESDSFPFLEISNSCIFEALVSLRRTEDVLNI